MLYYQLFLLQARGLIILIDKKIPSEVDYKSKEITSLTQTGQRAGYSCRHQDDLDLDNRGSFTAKKNPKPTSSPLFVTVSARHHPTLKK